MTDYVPPFLKARAITKTASAAVTGGRLVYVSGDNTVANSGASANIPVGVAAFDVASGEKVTIFPRGTVHRLTAAGTVTAADLVEAGALGTVATHTAGTNDARVFGAALTTATTGSVVEIMEF